MIARLRRFPPLVYLILVVWVGLLFGYSQLFPTYRAPDEPQHISMVLRLRSDPGYPAWDEGELDQQLVSSLPLVGFEDRADDDSQLSAEEADRLEGRSFDDLWDNEPNPGRNQMTQHPPLYYALLSGSSTVITSFVPDEVPWLGHVGLLRLLNLALVAPLPLLAFRAGEHLRLTRPMCLTAALVPFVVPQLAHIGSVVNNDNLLTLLLGVLAVQLARVVGGGDDTRRTALLVGVVSGLALLTKGFAFIAPVWVMVAYGVTATRVGWTRVARRLAEAGIVTAVIAGWWWIRNLVVHGEIQPSVDVIPTVEGFQPDLGEWLPTFFELLLPRFWGSFGWYEVTIPWGLADAATVVFVGLLVAGLVLVPRQRRGLAVTALPLLGLLVLVALFSWQNYADTSHFPGVQGRYLFAAIVAVAPVLGAGMCGLLGLGRRDLARFGPVVLLVLATAFHLYAVLEIVPHYWGTEDSSLGYSLRSAVAWSPWPTGVVVLAGLVTAAAWLGLVGVLGRAGPRVTGGARERGGGAVGDQTDPRAERDDSGDDADDGPDEGARTSDQYHQPTAAAVAATSTSSTSAGAVGSQPSDDQ